VVGTTGRAVRKGRQVAPKEFWKKLQKARRGHPPSKLQREQVGPVAKYLSEHPGCSVAEVLGFIRRQRSLVHVLVGTIIGQHVAAAIGIWAPSFFVRYHDLEVHEVARVLAPLAGATGMFGVFFGGLFADYAARRDPSRAFRVMIASLVLMAPAIVVYLTRQDAATAFAAYGVYLFTSFIWVAGATAMAHMERPGRVGGDKLHVDRPALPTGAPSVVRAPLHDLAHLRRERVARQPEVDEPGTCDFDPGHERGREGELTHDLLGQHAGILPQGLGENQREIGREVSVTGIARPLERERRVRRAEPGGNPLELGAEHRAHSAAFFAGLTLVSGLGADASGLSDFSDFSDFASGLGADSSGALRGPFPSLP